MALDWRELAFVPLMCYNLKLKAKGASMRKIARMLLRSVVGLTAVSSTGFAQQAATSSSDQLSGPEMVFLLLLVGFVLGGWVWYESIRKHRAV